MIGLIAGALKGLFGTINSVVKNKTEAKKLCNEIQGTVIELYTKIAEHQKGVLQTEMQGSWLQRNWRPLLMLVFTYIVFNNYVLAPYIKMFYAGFPIVEVPDRLWTLLTVGVGGYIGGRSIEKAADKVAQVFRGK